MTGRNRELDNLAHRLDRAANTIGDIYAHLDEQRAYVSVLTANAPDGMPQGQGSHSDPTARAFHQLKRVEDRRDELASTVAELNTLIGTLERRMSSARAFRVSLNDDNLDHLDDQPACRNDGCHQIPAERTDPSGNRIDDGYCLDCGRVYDRQQWEAAEERRRRRADLARLRYHAS